MIRLLQNGQRGLPKDRMLHLIHYHSDLGENVPFVSGIFLGRSTPACQGHAIGASGCLALMSGGSLPLMFTSGDAGASLNFNQQSPCV